MESKRIVNCPKQLLFDENKIGKNNEGIITRVCIIIALITDWCIVGCVLLH